MTKRRVTISTPASRDLASILEYVAARHGVDDALVVDALLDRALRSLDGLPDRGRAVPELASRGFHAHREIFAGPYRIVYRAGGRDVWVVAIVDGRRDLEELLYERARR